MVHFKKLLLLSRRHAHTQAQAQAQAQARPDRPRSRVASLWTPTRAGFGAFSARFWTVPCGRGGG